MHELDSIEDALTALAQGRPVVVVDDENRENEGDLILAAELATPESIAFMIRFTSGLLCVALPSTRTAALALPQMVDDNQDARTTAYTVTTDFKHGTTTGISARERAMTIRALVDPGYSAVDFIRPGHILPLRAREGGVFVRQGHTEAAVDLTTLAGLQPGGVLAEITNSDGSIANYEQSHQFAQKHNLPIITIEELVRYRQSHEQKKLSAPAALPTKHGTFTIRGFREFRSGLEHAVVTMGSVDGGEQVITRVHSECMTGESLGSLRCDCQAQLDEAMRRIAVAGSGVLIYLRGQEGRGIGLYEKVQAYALQDSGLSTLAANLELGHPADGREYSPAAEILKILGVRSVKLLTNSPAKCSALEEHGIDVVARVSLEVGGNAFNFRYLRDKRELMGHLLADEEPTERDIAYLAK